MNKTIFKWAGNKTKLTPAINELLKPYQRSRLVEPFVGSASLFLNSNFQSYLLSDSNETIIDFYSFLKDEGQKFINDCHDFFAHNSEDSYRSLRNIFNETQSKRLKAVLFLYLNRHCFNGLCRFSAKGDFNTPYGHYPHPYFPEKEMLYFHEKANSCKVEFRHADFQEILAEVKKGDVIYCDPPYVPLSTTASFVGYSKGGFTQEEQVFLAEQLKTLALDSIPSVISNADTVFTREMYAQGDINSLDVARFVAAKGDSRKKAREVMVLFTKEIIQEKEKSLTTKTNNSKSQKLTV